MSPVVVLEYLVIGTILGAIGQLIRVFVGLKKQANQAVGQDWSTWFDAQRLLISLGISATIGAIAGILAVIGILQQASTGTPVISAASLVMLITIGYSGTDFIEGFMQTQSMAPSTATSTLAPAVTLTPTTVDFGSQTVGSPTTVKTVTLINTGTAPLLISGVATSPGFTAVNSSGSSLAPAASSDIQITFNPDVPGAADGFLFVIDNASGSPHKLGLKGTGIKADS